MYQRSEPLRQKSLASAKLVTAIPHSSWQERSGKALAVGDDCPAFSLMERVLTFLDRYGATKGSPSLTR